jgi:hypothetical protein
LIASLLLGLSQCRIGMIEQLFDFFTITGVKSDANASRDKQFLIG